MLLKPEQNLAPGKGVLLIDGDPIDYKKRSLRMGIARLASQILEAGYSVKVLGAAAKDRPVTNEQVQRRIGKKPESILMTAISIPYTEGDSIDQTEIDSSKVLEILKGIAETRNDMRIVMGGPGITLNPEWALKHFAEALGPDFDGCLVGVEGEGDLIIQELAGMDEAQMMADDRLWRVAKDGEVLPGQLQFLSEKELSALKPVDPRITSKNIEGKNRGCRYKCAYCASCNITKPGTREFSPESYVDRLEARLRNMENISISFLDNDFLAGGMDWWREVHRILEERGLLAAMQYYNVFGYTNPGTIYDLKGEDIKLLRSLGFTQIGIGVQSFREEVLRRNNRAPIKFWKLVAFCDICNMVGIRPSIDMIMGLPTGMTDDELIRGRTSSDLFTALYASRCGEVIYRKFAPIRGSRLFRDGYDLSESDPDNIGLLYDAKRLFPYLECAAMLTLTPGKRVVRGPVLDFPDDDFEKLLNDHEIISNIGRILIDAKYKDNPEKRKQSREIFFLNDDDPDKLREIYERFKEIETTMIEAYISSAEEDPGLDEEIRQKILAGLRKWEGRYKKSDLA